MVKTKIEWCDSSWNPVSGCYHDCPYCYARGTANRFKGCNASPDGTTDDKIVELSERVEITNKDGITRTAAYPYGFTPTFHKYRLADPHTKGLGKTIFVCSTADLFGEWVPDEWIEQVFESCKKALNHRYLFLTKNPKRYYELAQKGKLPEEESFWYGSTVTSPDMPVFFSATHNTYVSIEPILSPFEQSEGHTNDLIEKVDWFIFGAETGKRKDKVVPKKEWIEDAVNSIVAAGKPVFMKDSLIPIWGKDILTEFPWKDE